MIGHRRGLRKRLGHSYDLPTRENIFFFILLSKRPVVKINSLLEFIISILSMMMMMMMMMMLI